MNKNNLSALAFTVLIGGLFFVPNATLACDTLETVTVDGITYTRVHSTLDACPPSETPAQTKLPGLVLPESVGPVTGGSSSGSTASVGTAAPTTSGTSGSKGGSSTLDTAGKFDCGDPSSGGMLQRAFSGAMSSFGSIFSEGGDFDLNGIFRDGASGLGEAGVGALGDYASGAISDAFGDSEIGQAAAQIVGSVVGDYIQEEGGAAIGSVVGSIFGSGSGSIGGDAVGSAVGSITGIGGGSVGIGGGSVPTANSKLEGIAKSTQDIVDETRTVTKQIDERGDILLQAECVSKPTLRSLISRAIQENVESTIENIAPLTITDRAKFKEDISQSAAETFIEHVTGDDELKARLIAAETEQRNPTPSDCGQSSRNIIKRFWTQAINYDKCGSGKFADAYGRLQSAKRQAVEQATEIVGDSGLTAPGTCKGRPDATFEECQGPDDHWIANLPADVAKDQLSKALDAPRERLNAADDFGAVISNAFSDLLSEVFASVGDEIEGGIRGLGNRIGSGSRSSGGSGNSGSTGSASTGGTAATQGGSYFDQLNGQTLTGSDQSSLLSQNIANAASVESAYRSTLETMISNLQTVSDAYKKVQVCYQTLANGTPTGITKEAAQTKANTASTTIAIGFTLQINQRKVELANSVSTASRLSILSNQAAQTTDAEDLRALASAYQSMVDAKETHTTADLETLVKKMNADASALQVLGRDAATQLVNCQAIH